MRTSSPVKPFYTTEKVILKKPMSNDDIRDMILAEGFTTDEIRFAKTFFAVMLCRNPKLLPRGEHLVVAWIRNVVSKKQPRQMYIQFELAEHCSTVVPLPPAFLEKIPPRVREKNNSWIRECNSLFFVKTSFKKPKVLKFKSPLDLVDGIKSTNILVSSSPAMVYDMDNNVKIAISVDMMAQIALASDHTMYDAQLV